MERERIENKTAPNWESLDPNNMENINGYARGGVLENRNSKA